ncbi:unnamed protein product, partial [Nesidiocoris tenuis]
MRKASTLTLLEQTHFCKRLNTYGWSPESDFESGETEEVNVCSEPPIRFQFSNKHNTCDSL